MSQHVAESDQQSWKPRFIAFPRFAIFISYGEAKTRLIWPGHYLARRSQSSGRWIYRRLRANQDSEG